MFDDPNLWDVLVWSFWFFIWICAVFIWFRCVFDVFGGPHPVRVGQDGLVPAADLRCRGWARSST